MKKLMSIALVLLTSSLVGCGARRQAMTATTTAQALTATAMAQPPVAQVPAVSTPRAEGVVLFQDDFQDGQPDGWQITAAWYVQQEGNVYQNELREDNNEKSGTVRIEAGGGGQQLQPDLVIRDLTIIPSNSEPKNHGTRAIADHGGVVAESDEENNIERGDPLQVRP